MEAKEKAIALVDGFKKDVIPKDWKYRAIGCALICVEEILLNIEATMLYHKDSIAIPINKEYWIEVKQELEKLSPHLPKQGDKN